MRATETRASAESTAGQHPADRNQHDRDEPAGRCRLPSRAAPVPRIGLDQPSALTGPVAGGGVAHLCSGSRARRTDRCPPDPLGPATDERALAARTSRAPPRARRGRTRAGAGCRGCSSRLQFRFGRVPGMAGLLRGYLRAQDDVAQQARPFRWRQGAADRWARRARTRVLHVHRKGHHVGRPLDVHPLLGAARP